MSKAMAVVGIIMLGILAFGVINVVQNVQNGNELDYYLLEETTEAAMIDAVDLAYYRYSGGIIRVDREKFQESFFRRFAENVNGNRNYHVKIIDFNETPPKVSIQVNSNTVAKFDNENASIVNRVDGIIESKYQDNRLLREIKVE